MNNLTLILVSETLFWVFFTRRASYLHACILLILVKVGWPILKSVSLHLFWRIPRAFIRGEFVETVKHHFEGWFGNPYKKYMRTDPLPIRESKKQKLIPREPSKHDIPIVPQNPGYPVHAKTDFLGNPIDEDSVVSANMRKIDREIEQFYRENG